MREGQSNQTETDDKSYLKYLLQFYLNFETINNK